MTGQSLLRKVKTRLSIHARRSVRGLLEGEYASVFHGRSTEFDDLRHYVAGDDLKDIDWKATARIGEPMIRRYIAERKHTIMLVVSSGRDMAASSESGERKADVALFVAGVIGYIATRHSDLVGLVTGDSSATVVRRPESTEAHLERLLQVIDHGARIDAPTGDLTRQLRYVAQGFRRRMILVVITDDAELGPEVEALLRRLSAQHEILWVTIGDADPTREEWSGAGMFEVADGTSLPAYLRSDRALRVAFQTATGDTLTRNQRLLDGLAISNQRVGAEAAVVPSILRLLQVQRSARR